MSLNCSLSRILAVAALVAPSALAQKVYTADDYARAERWMSYNVNGLVHHTIARPEYLPDGRVYYRDPGKDSTAYMIADPAKATTAPAFDVTKLAAAISTASGKPVDAKHLSVQAYSAEQNGRFAVATRTGTFRCDAAVTACTMDKPQPAAAGGRRRHLEMNMSPDGTKGLFIREHNLWVRDTASGTEKQLTKDGEKDFGYATDNAGWQHSDGAVATWSADGKKIATFQMDERKTGLMYLVPVTNRHPQLEAWHYPLVGDKDVSMVSPVVIDVDTASVVRLKLPPIQHRSMECDDISCSDNAWSDAQFSADGKHLAFVSTSRDHKDEWLKVADTATGDVRDVYHEHVDSYYGWQSKTDWKYLPASDEFLWVSERSNWAQIYLYDLKTGQVKNQITHGDGPISDILNVDEKHRVIYFTAFGKEKGEDPYFDNYYRVDFDGKNQKLLTPEVATHSITPSPDGSSFVDIYSTIQQPQTAVLRDNNGKVLVTLGKQDASELLAAGWKPPMPVTVKARDGKTPLYGFLWRPTNFDASKKYPVIDNVYPGPQGSLCQLGGRGFAAARGDEQAVSDLGFVVVCIDGMGNPMRSKSFHDAHASSPADMGDDTIPDQVSGIKDLAAQFQWVDATKVGIWGHSGGGNATASAMFHFPDFFSVGWSESGNHDNRDYEDDWDERWAGIEVIGPDGKSNYDSHANQNWAKNLKGHLMLVHGTMDDNVPPNNTLLVVDALIKANKNFDLIMVPNAHHGYGDANQYTTRRRWDYFVQHLAGGTPPHEFKFVTPEEIQKKNAANGPSEDEDDDADFDVVDTDSVSVDQ
jgi:dipeptidyl aminopeptidase/acylaminoacyl peptidase